MAFVYMTNPTYYLALDLTSVLTLVKVYNKIIKTGKNMGKQVKTTKNNGKLSLYPLKFEQAVKELLEVKPQIKIKQSK